jgi:dTDP-4-dehydrorhamnose 3,5-epimerase
MKSIQTQHPDVIILKPDVYSDHRGFFIEIYQKERFTKQGITHEFVQDNLSSSKKFTLRGLHYQVSHIQGKLVRAVVGEIFDVAIDLRSSSPHFGKWVGVNLSEDNNHALWIPPGFAHGFLALSDRADVLYKTTDFYDPDGERCIRWDDPTLAIDWPIPNGASPMISEKDACGSFFKDAEVFND